jgi:hypothetical protein
MTAGKPQTVNIVKHDNEFRLVPPWVVLSKGETVEIVNYTDGEADVDFPAAAFPGLGKQKVPKKEPAGPGRRAFVVPGGGVSGPYKWPMNVLGQAVRGFSDPMIIIDQ